MRLLIIDNYDSFTFNIQHLCEPHVLSLDVIRNDYVDLSSINQYDKIIISPGPGLPVNSGSCLDIIREFSQKKPILGICLGAQAIAVAYGLDLYNLKRVMHGKQSEVKILDSKNRIYKDLPKKILVGRYHSWAIQITNSDPFLVTAISKEDVVMSFEHKIYPLTGIQYHPESILTNYGKDILVNWLKN